MTIINDSTVVVYDSNELKNILEGSNNYTKVYFGSNITLESGIKISSSKNNIIIDGTYNGVTYKFEDKKSASAGDTITASSALIKNVTVQNMDITSYNYYGIIYVPDNNTYKDIVVEYNNITYLGPQISFHPTGLTRFVDCNITVQENYSAGNEVAECNKIEIGGTTTILHKSTANSSFWFRGSNPSFTILPFSNVNFTSEKRELFYGVTDLTFTISKNASFYVTTYSGMGYGSNGTGTTLIDQNALFSLKQTNNNGSYPTWYSYGVITLNSNSTLSIINDYNNITSSNYNIYFTDSKSGFILNNPLKVVLYNKIANVIYTNSTTSFEFNFNRINLFDKVITIDSNISLDTLPTYSWYKEKDVSTITGTFTNSKTTITSNNYTEEELASLPDLNNFLFQNKKIISIGTFQITMNALTDQDTVMKGVTEPLSSVLITYNDKNEVVLADNVGNFSYSYDSPLSEGTKIIITVKKQNDLIYSTKSITIVYNGELVIDEATSVINFNFIPIKDDPILCPRLSDLEIIVTDSRAVSSDWKLYATLNHDLESSSGIILKDSLVFVDDNDNILTLSDSPTLVYTGKNNNGSTKITYITFDDDRGILFKVNDPLVNNMIYDSIITWSIEE